MPLEIGVSSSTFAASASHHEKNASTMCRDLFSRIFSFFLRGASANERSMRKSEPMKPSAILARGIRLERLEEVAPAMRPAVDLDDVAALVEMVVDDVRVGNEV